MLSTTVRVQQYTITSNMCRSFGCPTNDQAMEPIDYAQPYTCLPCEDAINKNKCQVGGKDAMDQSTLGQ
jgi:hypothetical protein